jgi:acyl dehydratase
MALPVVIPSFAACKYYIGQSFGWTEWIEITQERIDAFIDASGDTNWLYCDPERAAEESPWKGAVAPGNLLLSLVPQLMDQRVVLIGWTNAINAGIDSCRFEAPVPAGSRTRMGVSLSRARTFPGGIRLSYNVDFEGEGVDALACSARVHYAYFK